MDFRFSLKNVKMCYVMVIFGGFVSSFLIVVLVTVSYSVFQERGFLDLRAAKRTNATVIFIFWRLDDVAGYSDEVTYGRTAGA